MNIEPIKVEIKPKGAPVLVDGVRVDGSTFIVTGRRLRTARLKNDWQEDVIDPEAVRQALTASGIKVDLLRFWQRIPDTKPKFPFYHEWRDVAAIPITTFDHWWEKQIRFRARNKMRKAQKLGVIIEQIELNDDFVRGVVEIYNQSPVRRGKPFRHYGKEFATVKAELSMDLSNAVFLAAIHKGELIGFIKFQIDDRYARITLILDKVTHRDKSPTNGLIAKAVEICARQAIPFLTYYLWRRGDHGKFQESVGFEKIATPEYFVPLTTRGKLALSCGLHNGVAGLIPERLITELLALRARWYERGAAELVKTGSKRRPAARNELNSLPANRQRAAAD